MHVKESPKSALALGTGSGKGLYPRTVKCKVWEPAFEAGHLQLLNIPALLPSLASCPPAAKPQGCHDFFLSNFFGVYDQPLVGPVVNQLYTKHRSKKVLLYDLEGTLCINSSASHRV